MGRWHSVAAGARGGVAGCGLDFTTADPRASAAKSSHPELGGARFLVVSSFVEEGRRLTFLARGARWPDTLARWLEQEVAHGRRVATFAPGVRGGSVPYRLDDTYTPFWDLGAWGRPGPTIRIYELNR
jgi:hypothetical protein